jgi:hypothetical protein
VSVSLGTTQSLSIHGHGTLSILVIIVAVQGNSDRVITDRTGCKFQAVSSPPTKNISEASSTRFIKVVTVSSKDKYYHRVRYQQLRKDLRLSGVIWSLYRPLQTNS